MSDYLEKLQEKLSSRFDITKNYQYRGFSYDLYCEMRVSHAKYALSKKVPIYGFQTKEIFFVRHLSTISLADIEEELTQYKTQLKQIVTPQEDHRSTQLILMYVVDGPIPSDVERVVKGFFCQKSFAFGLKGWVDLGAITVSLQEQRVVSHRRIKKTATFFLPE